MGIGGWVVAVMTRRRTRERVWRVAGRWTTCAALAYAAAWGIASLVWMTGLLPGEPLSHLDVGAAVALPFAVWFAFLPTLRCLVPIDEGRLQEAPIR
jgi:hypothetical protein